MKLLMIDTSTIVATAAVLDEDRLIAETIVNYKKKHSEKMLPSIDHMLQDSGLKLGDIDVFGVVNGPGSFTGLRIGMATAKAFAQVWNKPIVCVPTLASFAYMDVDPQAIEGFPEGVDPLICPLFDARRSQVYAGVYLPGCKDALLADGAYDVPDYLEKLGALLTPDKTAVFFGDGCDAYRETLENSGLPHVFAPQNVKFQLAHADLNLALELYEEGQLTDCYNAQPEYLRLAEAERKLKAGALRKMP